MKLKTIFALIFTTLVAVNAFDIDYCDEKLCTRGRKHVGCNHPLRFASSCPAGINIVRMTHEMRDAIVNEHNLVRSKVASGKEKAFLGAARMRTIVSIYLIQVE